MCSCVVCDALGKYNTYEAGLKAWKNLAIPGTPEDEQKDGTKLSDTIVVATKEMESDIEPPPKKSKLSPTMEGTFIPPPLSETSPFHSRNDDIFTQLRNLPCHVASPRTPPTDCAAAI